MKIELLDYGFENEDCLNICAFLWIMADDIPIRWHIIPAEWDIQSEWVTLPSGIGAPGDEYDVSALSANDQSLLFGERYDLEEILDFEEKVESALREKMGGIRSEMRTLFLATLDRELNEKLELIDG